MKRKPPELLPGALFYARFPAPPAPLQGLFIWGGLLLYPYYIRGLIWLYRGGYIWGYILGLVLAFALCPCALGSCVSSCVACFACWVLAFVLVLRGLPLMASCWGLPLPLSIGYILLNVWGYTVNRVLYWLLVALSF